MTICRFFNTPDGCRFGADCPFDHIRGAPSSRRGSSEGPRGRGRPHSGRGRGRGSSNRNQSRTSADDISIPSITPSSSSRTSQRNAPAFRPPVQRPVVKSFEERLKNASDPHERAALMKEQEMNQLERRYRDASFHLHLQSDGSSGERQSHVIEFKLSPTDPDFPFELDALELELTVPALYPIDLDNVTLRVLNAEIPAPFKRNIESAFKRKIKAARIPLLSMMTWLDTNLESLLSAPPPQPEQSVIVAAVSNKQSSLEESESEVHNDQSHETRKEESEESESFTYTDEETDEEVVTSALAGLSVSNDNAPYGISITLPDIHTENLSLLTVSDLCLTVRCSRCKSMNTIDHLSPCPPGKEKDVESGTFTSCTGCNQTMFIRFRPHVVHQGSRDIGYLDAEDCVPFDLLPSTFDATCENCLNPQIGAFKLVQRGILQKYQCRSCHTTSLQMRLESVELISLVSTRAQPSEIQTSTSSSSNMPLKRVKKKKPRDDTRLILGQPLPKKGTCEHYKKSYRWLRFPCCGKLFPCDICHEMGSDGHEMKWANRMVCGYCSKEQPYSQTPCACGHSLTRQSGTRFWEGGSGVRDKTRMSKRDPHKYKGTAKTVSRKAASSLGSKKAG